MRKNVGWILIGLGFLFLLNAIFGRYLVLPGYLSSLEEGRSTVASVSQTVSGWKIARYLLWGYSFKLGIFLIILGGTFRVQMAAARRWLVGIGGFVYISFAYIPLPEPSSLVFGLVGGFMTVIMVAIFLHWFKTRDGLDQAAKTASGYRMAGFFFFGMASYTLCPLLGVKGFALYPDKAIQYGLQAEIASLSFHLLSELVLGWSFMALSLVGRSPKTTQRSLRKGGHL